MIPYWIMLIYSLSHFMMTTFRNSIQDGMKFYYLCQKPSDFILESLYKVRIRESAQLKNCIGSVRHGDSSEDIDAQLSKDEKMVKRCTNQKLRLRSFDTRHGKIETCAVVKNRKASIGVEGGKGICYKWKGKRQRSKGDRCSFRHETQDRAQKQEHTAATPSEPTA